MCVVKYVGKWMIGTVGKLYARQVGKQVGLKLLTMGFYLLFTTEIDDQLMEK